MIEKVEEELTILKKENMEEGTILPLPEKRPYACTLCVCVCHNEKKCQTNGKRDKRYQRYLK